MSPILAPTLLLVFHTFIIFLCLWFVRAKTLAKHKKSIEAFGDPKLADQVLAPSDLLSENVENLFELPVLYYVAICLIVTLKIEHQALFGLTWAFVTLRIIHSIIHCTINRIFYRFLVFFLSYLVLIGIWVVITLQLMSP